MKIVVLTCLFLAALSCVRPLSVSTADSDGFMQFIKTYGKTYPTVDEFNKRFGIWRDAVDLIARHNKLAEQGLSSYTLAMNRFGDMTLEEFKTEMLGFNPDMSRPRNFSNTEWVASSPLPDSVDWRAKGYVTEVGNQGQCGSCWAFTATGALEGAHKKKTGTLVDLSEQNLMDCSQKQGNLGCSGGMMDYSFTYVKTNGGIDTEQSYPYNQTNPGVMWRHIPNSDRCRNLGCTGGYMDQSFTYVKVNGGIDTEQSYPYNQTNPGEYKCRYTKENRGATCTGFVDLPKGSEKALQQAVAMIGPVAGAIDGAQESFMYYKSGVWDEPKCNKQSLDHSLLVVGYGTLDGKDYYDCKNSWGTSWGDKGFVKIARNKDNQCGIATLASYPTV